jgi:hypothetical protein
LAKRSRKGRRSIAAQTRGKDLFHPDEILRATREIYPEHCREDLARFVRTCTDKDALAVLTRAAIVGCTYAWALLDHLDPKGPSGRADYLDASQSVGAMSDAFSIAEDWYVRALRNAEASAVRTALVPVVVRCRDLLSKLLDAAEEDDAPALSAILKDLGADTTELEVLHPHSPPVVNDRILSLPETEQLASAPEEGAESWKPSGWFVKPASGWLFDAKQSTRKKKRVRTRLAHDGTELYSVPDVKLYRPQLIPK